MADTTLGADSALANLRIIDAAQLHADRASALANAIDLVADTILGRSTPSNEPGSERASAHAYSLLTLLIRELADLRDALAGKPTDA